MKSFIINLMPGFFVRLFARPYVSGDSIEKGILKAKELYEDSIYSTLDLLGEAVTSKEMVEINVQTYSDLITKLSGTSYATVSLKPTSLGIHESKEYCEQSIRQILMVAKKHNISITIDMEDHPFTDPTLDLYRTLIKEFPTLGTVLQSRLYRTDQDIEDLEETKGRIRICIGIYKESEDIALQDKADMKVKMLEQTEKLLDAGFYVEFATHDVNTIETMLEMAKKKGYTSEQLEFQQLLGVPMEKTQQLISDSGFINRLYVPFATHWDYAIPYLKRRLANNPKMAWYVLNQTTRKIFGRR